MKKRYSCDYSRWEEKKFIPDDDATKEEEVHVRQLKDKVRSEMFEKDNKEFCEQMKNDMKCRSELKRQEQLTSKKLCDRGKYFFRQGSYIESREMFEKALKKAPYETTTLVNMAMVQGKLCSWTEAMEYCNRALHTSRNNSLKATFHRHKAYMGLNDYHNALSDLTQCCVLDPNNKYFQRCRKDLDLQIQSKRLQRQIDIATRDLQRKGSGSRFETVSKEKPMISLEDWSFKVSTTKGDKGHEASIKTQCKIIDECMETINWHGCSFLSSHKLKNDGSYKTIGDLLGTFKVQSCPVARSYMRTSGYFDDIFHNLERLCIALFNKQSKDTSKQERADLIASIDLSMKILKNDHLSRLKFYEVCYFFSIVIICFFVASS